jgi:preprotein translocase subunit SecA
MSVLNKVLGLFLGNKYERDMKEIDPYVILIHKEFDKLQVLTNDELRDKTADLKNKILAGIAENLEEIKQLRDKAEKEEDVYIKEEIYNTIDKLEKNIEQKLESILDEHLPAAFAIVKETARRFKENSIIEVTAQQYDRDLAATRPSITIKGDRALWNNKWMAGGNEITWDMIHYDVQLFGGVALHKGKIAEMATGEGKTVVATLPVFLNALAGRGVHIVTVNDYLSKRDSEWMGPIYEFHGLTVDCIDKHQPNSVDRRKAYNADITFGTNNEFGFDYLRDNMAVNPEDLVQRKHHYAIVDEVDSVLIDDARTPLIISGPTAQADNQQFDELKPKVERLVSAQKKLVTQILADAKKLIADNKNEEGGLLLLRANKGLPRNNALIKFLSEEGNKSLLLKTENFYMQNNNKDMPKVTEELFFVIDEKGNSIELTEKGIDLISTSVEDASFFILPDVGSKIAEIEKSNLEDRERLRVKDELLQDYSVKSERVHTMTQLLKAYTLFERDDEYVVMENKVKIVDEQTGRILEGRRYSDGLHQAIEAKENVKVEAATQTYATITLQNYFRMYHKLAGMTGTAETEAGELWNIYKLDVVVIPTNQACIRKDREDIVYKTKREKYNAVIDEIALMNKQGRPVLVGTTSVEISELLSRMLKMKGLKHNVLNAKLHQREAEIVAEAGKPGTVTIATNMAGRGRQGDPGSSQFFVSLEDELMRLFGSERIAGIMDKLGLKEGEMIQHSMITKSIERAQKKVEENNFGIRKRLLEYDDVMNSQREVIYKKRKHALLGERLSVDVANMMYDVTEILVETYHKDSDYEGFDFDLIRSFSMDSPIPKQEFLKAPSGEIVDRVYKKVLETYKRKEESISKQAYPVLKDVYDRMSHVYENVVVPISDGVKVFQVVTNLKATAESEGKELARAYEKTVVLATIDEAWKEHLREMDELKQSVQNATYEQKDPLLIYKFESFELFRTILNKVNKDVVSTLMKGHIPSQDPEQVKEAERRRQVDMSNLRTSKSDFSQYSSTGGGDPDRRQKTEPVRVEKKVGRNDPCPCGSGKKFKQCHGQQQPGSPEPRP